MTEQENPVSEGDKQPEVETEETTVEQPEQKEHVERTVPLTALEAERKKRQEIEAENRLYQQHFNQAQQTQEPSEDDSEDWVTKKEYRKSVNETKRDILEEAFVQSNPEAYQKISDYLPELIRKKPWVKDVVENAGNRWQRAWELIKDLHLPEVEKKTQKSQEAQRIVENSNKPGSPSSVGKSRAASSVEYLRSIRNTPEWDEYREKLRSGRA